MYDSTIWKEVFSRKVCSVSASCPLSLHLSLPSHIAFPPLNPPRTIHATLGTPFYINANTGSTTWTIPDSLLAARKAHNPHYPWKECLSKEGVTYYWNQVTNETLWDAPEGIAKGKR